MPATLDAPEDLRHGDAGGLPPSDWDGDDGGRGDDDDHDGNENSGPDPRRWVTLATFWHPTEAHLARLRLEHAGVACVLLDELTAATNCFAIAVGGVKLQVPKAQAGRAAALLGREREREQSPAAPVGVARFARLIDAKSAACVAEAAGLTVEVRAVDDEPPALASKLLPAAVLGRLWPAAWLTCAQGDAEAVARSLRPTPFAAGLVRRAASRP